MFVVWSFSATWIVKGECDRNNQNPICLQICSAWHKFVLGEKCCVFLNANSLILD